MSFLKQMFVLQLAFFVFINAYTVNAQSDMQPQSGWEFNTSIYAWFAGIDGTVGLVDKEKQIDATPGDLLNNLEFTMGGSFEARTSKVNLIADVFYMGLGKEAKVEKTIR